MVTVPETSINEYARLILPQHHVRLPRQPRMVKTITETVRPQEVSHYHLRLSILTMDSRHIYMSLMRCQSISHNHPLPLSYYTLYRYKTTITIAIQNTKLQIKSHNPPFSFPFHYQTEEKKDKVIIPIIEPLQKILDEIAAEPVLNGFVFPDILQGATHKADKRKRISQENSNVQDRVIKATQERNGTEQGQPGCQTNLLHT